MSVNGLAGATLIAASALEAGCATLYSEDLQPRQVLEGRLTVWNPFGRGRGARRSIMAGASERATVTETLSSFISRRLRDV
jgi:hypothetical protein